MRGNEQGKVPGMNSGSPDDWGPSVREEPRPQEFPLLRADRATPADLENFLVNSNSAGKAIEKDHKDEENLGITVISPDIHWLIFFNTLVRWLLFFFKRPMELFRLVLELFLNGGGLRGFIQSLFAGRNVVRDRSPETYLSVVGHVDTRLGLHKLPAKSASEIEMMGTCPLQMDDEALMDLCVMASKVAYENADVVQNTVNKQWKMHFMKFYDFWNEKEKEAAYFALRNMLRSLLAEHPKARFLVTGHGTGGALAALLPAIFLFNEERELINRWSAVYTFGQPRIGDEQLGQFMKAHSDKYFRVVYGNDVMPSLPYDDGMFYKHFGQRLHYNSRYFEKMEEEPSTDFIGFRSILPEFLNSLRELMRGIFMQYVYGPEYKETWFLLFSRVLALVEPAVSAHSLANYINCVRLGRRVRNTC